MAGGDGLRKPHLGSRRINENSIACHVHEAQWRHMGGCQNYGPLLDPLNTRCRIILGTQKGTIVLTTTHMFLEAEKWDAAAEVIRFHSN